MYKILIVDDESDIRNGYAKFFPWEQLEFEVAGTASNGEQALEFLADHPVDVVLCDIVMPHMDGILFTETLACSYPNIKVIVLSGHSNFEYARKMMRPNVFAYVLKSDKHSVLIETLTRLKEQLAVAPKNSDNKNIIEKVQQYVQKNISDASLQTASEMVHMNMNYLSKLFKEKTGENFYSYVLNLKLEKAKELLKNPDAHISEISDQLGYSHPKNFIRVFKKETGISPKEYQRKNVN